MINDKRIVICFTLITVMLTGCATTSQLDQGPPDSVFEISRNVFASKNAILLWVESYGAVADATFNALSSAKPSRMARDLAETLKIAIKKEFYIVCAGPNSAKTRRVVLDALSLQKEDLPGLHLLFIGNPSHESDIQQAVEDRGGNLYFREYSNQ